ALRCLVARRALQLQPHSVSTAWHVARRAAARVPGSAAHVLFVAEYSAAWPSAGESRQRLHVAELLPDQRNAPRGREPARSLSAGRYDMAGALAPGELIAARASARDGFALATHEDDADLRALLRRSAMPGAIRVAFTREPSYFA